MLEGRCQIGEGEKRKKGEEKDEILRERRGKRREKRKVEYRRVEKR